MAEIVYRFMDARTVMSLVAGNWASFHSDLASDEEGVDNDGLLAVEMPWVRFENAPSAPSGTRGGVVALDITPLVPDEEYRVLGEATYVMADVLVGEPVTIELRP